MFACDRKRGISGHFNYEAVNTALTTTPFSNAAPPLLVLLLLVVVVMI